MNRALLLAFCIFAGPARAQTDSETYLENWRRTVLPGWVLDARICMRKGIDTQVMMGTRDVEKIIEFILPPCGEHIARVMDSEGAHGEAFAHTLAVQELRKYPGLNWDKFRPWPR
jgi:hypothetical protein